MLVDGKKRCNYCFEYKTPENFHRRSGGDGLQYKCKPCNQIVKKAWEDAHRDHMRVRYRKADLRRYGMTPEMFAEMLAAQGDGCAICGSPDDKGGRGLHVDHCHETKTVRGLLCGPCNRGLGMFQDSPERLAKASDYLALVGRIRTP